MVNFAQNFIAGQQMGRERRLQDEALAKQSQLGRLVGESLTAPVTARDSYLGQIAGLDPNAALTLSTRFQGEAQAQREAEQARVQNMARLFAVAPAQSRATMWGQIRPALQGMGFEAPEAWDEGLMPVVQQLGGVTGESFRPMVVAPGSALVGPDGRVVFQNPGREDPGTLVDVPVVRNGVRGTEKRIWRGGQLLPLDQAVGGGSAPQTPQPSAQPVMDAVLAQANEMARRGVPDADIERYIASAAQQGGVQVTPTQAQLDANAQRTIQSQTFGAPAPMPAPAAAPATDSVGFDPGPAQPRMATPQELAQFGYAPGDLVEIQPTGVPRPIRATEAPGAKAPSAETANRVSLYDNALRAAIEWRSLVVSPDGSFNDIAARMPQAKALLTQALRAKLRAESGASISAEEISGETDRYMGGLFSSDSTAVQKATALVDDLTNQRVALDPSGMIRPAIPAALPQQPASQPSSGGIRIISVTPAGQQ